jgi:hypothetical protein
MPLDLSALEHRVHQHPPGTDITLPRNDVMAALQRLRETEMYFRHLLQVAFYNSEECRCRSSSRTAPTEAGE